jgi:hypothetical protein
MRDFLEYLLRVLERGNWLNVHGERRVADLRVGELYSILAEVRDEMSVDTVRRREEEMDALMQTHNLMQQKPQVFIKPEDMMNMQTRPSLPRTATEQMIKQDDANRKLRAMVDKLLTKLLRRKNDGEEQTKSP